MLINKKTTNDHECHVLFSMINQFLRFPINKYLFWKFCFMNFESREIERGVETIKEILVFFFFNILNLFIINSLIYVITKKVSFK